MIQKHASIRAELLRIWAVLAGQAVTTIVKVLPCASGIWDFRSDWFRLSLHSNSCHCSRMADWQHLADVLVAARVRLGYNRRAELVRARGLSHDRVLADLENAKRDNYEAATLVQVEHWYGLAPGNVREVLAGEPARYADAVSVSPDEESDGVYLDLGPDFYKGLTPTGERVLRADIAALKARLKADAERARAAADEL